MSKGPSYKEYYEQNKERILEARRRRYAEDPEYRQRAIQSSKRSSLERRANSIVDMMSGKKRTHNIERDVEVNGETQTGITLPELCEKAGLTYGIIARLMRNGVVPVTPFVVNGVALYTSEMMHAMRVVLAGKNRIRKGDGSCEAILTLWAQCGVTGIVRTQE